MEIKIDKFVTEPATIHRQELSDMLGRKLSTVTLAIEKNYLDWGKVGRHKMVVVNEKYHAYVTQCKVRDYCTSIGFLGHRIHNDLYKVLQLAEKWGATKAQLKEIKRIGKLK